MPDEFDELLETSEAARLADTSEATVRRAERLGLLPAVRTRRGVRLFKRGDVEAFAKAREQDRRRKTAAIGSMK